MAHQGQRIENPVTGQTMIFLETGEDTNGEMFKAEGIFRPGGFAGPPHVHPVQEERFTVTQGTAGFKVGSKQVRLGPNETIMIAAGQPHTFWNDGPDQMSVVMEFRPALASTGRFYEFFFGMARAGLVGKDGMPSIWQVVLQSEEFADHVRLVSPPWAIQRFAFTLLKPIARLLGYRIISPESLTAREQAKELRTS